MRTFLIEGTLDHLLGWTEYSAGDDEVHNLPWSTIGSGWVNCNSQPIEDLVEWAKKMRIAYEGVWDHVKGTADALAEAFGYDTTPGSDPGYRLLKPCVSCGLPQSNGAYCRSCSHHAISAHRKKNKHKDHLHV